MSGTTATVAQLGTEIVGQAAAPTATVAQLGTEIVGQAAAPTATVAQLGTEIVGQAAQPVALAVSFGWEIIAPLPILPPRSAAERSFPAGFVDYPPRGQHRRITV